EILWATGQPGHARTSPYVPTGILADVEEPTPTDRQTQPVPPAAPPVGGARPRARRGPRDMIISLLVLLVPVLVLVGGSQLIAGRAGAAPQDLGDGWVPVSAQFDEHATGGTLRVGYVTPAGDPVQVVHSTVPPEVLLPQRLPDAGPPTGEVRLGDENWQRFPGRPNEQALVRMTPGLTTIVVGTADDAELQHLATHSCTRSPPPPRRTLPLGRAGQRGLPPPRAPAS